MSYKPIEILPDSTVKGNCDAELVLEAMKNIPNYNKAVIVTSDGDFGCLVEYLLTINKLERVVSPCLNMCSHLLRKAAGTKIDFIDNLRDKLEYKEKRKEPHKDQPL